MGCEVSIEINSIILSVALSEDQEWKKIKERLWNKYGIRSLGSKAADKQKLHELEMIEVEQLGGECDSSRFITVTRAEIEKVKNKRRDKNIKKDPKEYPHTEKGAKILGEQIYLAIKMKKEQEDKDNKRKRDNKYLS